MTYGFPKENGELETYLTALERIHAGPQQGPSSSVLFAGHVQTCQSTVLNMMAKYLEQKLARASTGAADRDILAIRKDMSSVKTLRGPSGVQLVG